MPPRANKAKTGEEDVTLTPQNIEVIAMAWCSVKSVKDGKPFVDLSKLVEQGKYKTMDSARHSWRPVEKKLEAIAAAAFKKGSNGDGARAPTPGGGAKPAKAPATKTLKTASLKRKSDPDTDGDDDEEKKIVGKKPRRALPKGSVAACKKKGTATKIPAKVKKEEVEKAAAEDGWNEYESFSEVDDGEA